MENIINNEVVEVKKQNNLLKIVVHIIFVVIIALGVMYLIKNRPECKTEIAKEIKQGEEVEKVVAPTVAQTDNSWKEFELKDYVKVSFQYPADYYIYPFYDMQMPSNMGIVYSRYSSVYFSIQKTPMDITPRGGGCNKGEISISVNYYEDKYSYCDNTGKCGEYIPQITDFEKNKKTITNLKESKFVSNGIGWTHLEGLDTSEGMMGNTFSDDYQAIFRDKNGKQIVVESYIPNACETINKDNYLKYKQIHEKIVKSIKITDI